MRIESSKMKTGFYRAKMICTKRVPVFINSVALFHVHVVDMFPFQSTNTEMNWGLGGGGANRPWFTGKLFNTKSTHSTFNHQLDHRPPSLHIHYVTAVFIWNSEWNSSAPFLVRWTAIDHRISNTMKMATKCMFFSSFHFMWVTFNDHHEQCCPRYSNSLIENWFVLGIQYSIFIPQHCFLFHESIEITLHYISLPYFLSLHSELHEPI